MKDYWVKLKDGRIITYPDKNTAFHTLASWDASPAFECTIYQFNEKSQSKTPHILCRENFNLCRSYERRVGVLEMFMLYEGRRLEELLPY
jgi:hypothetical protein